MKELVSIELFLNVNNSIFEAQILNNVNMSKIYISGKYWNNTLISDFKAAMLTIDKSIHRKYLESLKNLASDVLKLYDKVNSLPSDRNTIGIDTQLLFFVNDFQEPHIMICKDYYDGKKWTWRIIWDNNWRPEDYELLSKSCITTEPKSVNELVRNDMISKWTCLISKYLSDIQPQSELTFKDLLIGLDESKKNEIIAKIQQKNRDKPIQIFYILAALKQEKIILETNNTIIYKAYFDEFGYKNFNSLKSGVGHHFNNWEKNKDKSYNDMINNVADYLLD